MGGAAAQWFMGNSLPYEVKRFSPNSLVLEKITHIPVKVPLGKCNLFHLGLKHKYKF